MVAYRIRVEEHCWGIVVLGYPGAYCVIEYVDIGCPSGREAHDMKWGATARLAETVRGERDVRTIEVSRWPGGVGYADAPTALTAGSSLAFVD